MVYFNVNGLDGFNFAKLLVFVALEAIDCMVLIDARVYVERASFLRREACAQLGPHAECLVSTPSSTGKRDTSSTG